MRQICEILRLRHDCHLSNRTMGRAVEMAYLHAELKRDGVTLQLLWVEYARQNPHGYRYSQFCKLYRRWMKKLSVSMRQVHRAGEKAFVDFSGKKPSVVDPKTGEVRQVELFVGVLGASSYTYARAVESQQLACSGR